MPAPPGVVALDRNHAGHRARVVINLGDDPVDVAELIAGWHAMVVDDDIIGPLPPGGSHWLAPDPG